MSDWLVFGLAAGWLGHAVWAWQRVRTLEARLDARRDDAPSGDEVTRGSFALGSAYVRLVREGVSAAEVARRMNCSVEEVRLACEVAALRGGKGARLEGA